LVLCIFLSYKSFVFFCIDLLVNFLDTSSFVVFLHFFYFLSESFFSFQHLWFLCSFGMLMLSSLGHINILSIFWVSSTRFYGIVVILFFFAKQIYTCLWVVYYVFFSWIVVRIDEFICVLCVVILLFLFNNVFLLAFCVISSML